MLPQPKPVVNTPTKLDSLFDGDARQVNRAERLAMTKAQMVIAAENRYGREYESSIEWQGGVGYVECIVPEGDRSISPWVHLLPIGKNDDGAMLYLVRGTGPQYGAPDWTESENMHEWLNTSDDSASWATAVMP